MALRTSLRLGPRSVGLDALVALVSGFSVGAVSWVPAGDALSRPMVLTASVLVAALLLLFRRTAPLVPFLFAAVVAAVSPPAVGAALPVAAYAVGRYTDRWPVRAVAALAGALAYSQAWTSPTLEHSVGALAQIAFAVLLPGAVGAWVRTRADLLVALTERAERAEAERELLARDAVLTERTRIAREMHDAVGHRVSLMVLQAGAIEMAAADRERVEQLARQVQTAGRHALDELRQAVGILRSGDDEEAPLAPQPGLEDLERLVKECRAAGMTVELHSPASESAPVDPVVSRAAYRVVQEALTNAAKHAPGAHVRVDVQREPDQLVVRVRSGPGGVVPEAVGGGFGLVGLRERVRTLDGRLRAEPRLDGGFVVEAVLPA